MKRHPQISALNMVIIIIPCGCIGLEVANSQHQVGYNQCIILGQEFNNTLFKNNIITCITVIKVCLPVVCNRQLFSFLTKP